MKHLFTSSLLLLAFLLPTTAFAYGIEVDGIYYRINGDEAIVSSCANYVTGDIHIPRTISYGGAIYIVTSIGERAFEEAPNITSVEIPNSVTTIERCAFYGCYSLTAIVIPRSVVTIGEHAFVSNPSLSSITVESGNPKYDSRNHCNAIIETATNTLIVGCQNTIIPNTVTAIGDDAFCWSGLTSIVIPNSVISIGNNAFQASELNSIEIPNSVTIIGDCAFMECYHLESVTISNSVTSIGIYAFCNCQELENISIPCSVTSIGDWAFCNCFSLKEIIIPKTVSYIGHGILYSCYDLISIIVEEGNPNYDSRDNCNAIIETESNTLIEGCQNTTIPNTITSIGNEALTCTPDLSSIEIPNSVKSIGDQAFSGCFGLKNVTIGNSLTSIGIAAFSLCTSLTSVSIPNSTTLIHDQAFESCSSLIDVYSFVENPEKISMGERIFYLETEDYTSRALHVPAGSLAAYQADENRNLYFGNIVEMETVSCPEIG